MKERVIHLIGVAKGRELFCNTFHAFCAEILQDNAHYIGFDRDFSIYDPLEQESVIKDILHDLDYKNMSFKKALAALKEDTKKGTKEDTLKKEYFFRMKQNNAIDFDSLIQFAIRLFKDFPLLREGYHNRFEYVFVDEFQDTSDDQWELITLLQPKNLFIVGDDFQGIYGWRGANINIILQIAKDTSYQTIKLEENYRSTIPIINAANTLIKHNRQTEKILRTEREGKPIVTITHDSIEDELGHVKELISEMVSEGQCDYRDIAILARTNKKIEAANLILDGVPRVVVNAISDPLKDADVKTLLTFIESARNEANESLIRKLLRSTKYVFTGKELLKIDKYQLETGASIIESICNIRSTNAENFVQMYDDICYLVERSMEDPLHLFNVAVNAIFGARYTTENIERAYRTLERWYDRQSDIEENTNVDAMLQWIRLRDIQDKFAEDTNEVKLMTVHASKGLEFNTVFIIGMNQGVFPSKGDIEEERRLFYVAITRAKENLFISRSAAIPNWSGNSKIETAESQFLQEMQK